MLQWIPTILLALVVYFAIKKERQQERTIQTLLNIADEDAERKAVRPTGRLRWVFVDQRTFVRIFCGESDCVTQVRFDDIPADARFVAAEFALTHNGWRVLFEHPSFDVVQLGHEAPQAFGVARIYRLDGSETLREVRM